MGMARPLTRSLTRSLAQSLALSVAFVPALLFAASEQGAWYDPSDLTTLYTTSTGTTQVASDSDPVGLMLDKRLWGGRTFTQQLAATTDDIVNGDFTTDLTGWSINDATRGDAVASGGRAVLTNVHANGSTAGFTGIIQTKTTVIGNWYRYRSNLGGTAGISASNNSNGTGAFAVASGTGDKVLFFQATATTTYLVHYVNSAADAATANFDDTSFKEIPGNHATQSTAAAKPIYKTSGGLHWLEGDGVDDWLRATFTISQPWERVSAIRQISWTSGDTIYGGGNAISGLLYQTGVTPELRLYDGAGAAANASASVGADVVATERHDNANSRLAINSGAYQAGTTGTNVPGGITIFAHYTASAAANIRCYGLTMYEGTLTDAEISKLESYLATKSGVSL